MISIDKYIYKLIYVRYCQLIINEEIKKKSFLIPIHLALGHEAIATALSAIIDINDNLLCTHRNLHYQFALGSTLKEIHDEFTLLKTGAFNGRGGSMNLSNPNKSIIYTSSILGNNLSVGVGVALANKIKNNNNFVCIVTGDGAIEEGSFYESLLLSKSLNLNILFIVENNGWSLATEIKERRTNIDLKKLSDSLGINYNLFKSNNVFEYLNDIKDIKNSIKFNSSPEILEVELSTLGGRFIKDNNSANEKYINYHAGLAPNIEYNNSPIIENNNNDPLFVAKNILNNSIFENQNKLVQTNLNIQF